VRISHHNADSRPDLSNRYEDYGWPATIVFGSDGGVCQYSTDGDWDHPHFEKIMQMQAENLRTYAAAYALWHDLSYLHAAKKVRNYLQNFLTSSAGAFYASQDADLVPGKHSAEYFKLSDSNRRKRGTPRIDQHIYSRENGWAVNALTTLYAVTDDKALLKRRNPGR